MCCCWLAVPCCLYDNVICLVYQFCTSSRWVILHWATQEFRSVILPWLLSHSKCKFSVGRKHYKCLCAARINKKQAYRAGKVHTTKSQPITLEITLESAYNCYSNETCTCFYYCVETIIIILLRAKIILCNGCPTSSLRCWSFVTSIWPCYPCYLGRLFLPDSDPKVLGLWQKITSCFMEHHSFSNERALCHYCTVITIIVLLLKSWLHYRNNLYVSKCYGTYDIKVENVKFCLSLH